MQSISLVGRFVLFYDKHSAVIGGKVYSINLSVENGILYRADAVAVIHIALNSALTRRQIQRSILYRDNRHLGTRSQNTEIEKVADNDYSGCKYGNSRNNKGSNF